MIAARLAILAAAALVGCSACDGEPGEAPHDDVTAAEVAETADGLSVANDTAPTPSGSIEELLLFFPSQYPEGNWQPSGLVYEDVEFAAPDGATLHGWYCPSPDPIATVLYLHGNAGNLSHRAPILRRLQRELGVTTLIIDYRGYGRSEGSASVAAAIEDARAAHAFLARKAGVAKSSIVLMGRSLGGALAVEVAAAAPVRALIIESTFSSLVDAAQHHYPYLAWIVPEAKLNTAARIAKFKGPLFQSHGDRDGTIPLSLGRRLFDAANDPKQFMEIAGADHNDRLPGAYYERLKQFLVELP